MIPSRNDGVCRVNEAPPRVAPRRVLSVVIATSLVAAWTSGACDVVTINTPTLPIYYNTTDRTNGGASFLTSTSCKTCHADIAQQYALHAHAFTLNRVQGGPPTFPAAADQAGVPNPPDGYAWSDISYLLGGYAKRALFIDNGGFILTTGLTGKATQWNLDTPPNGTTPGFADFAPTAAAPLPYDFDRFRYETTGPAPQDPSNPLFQENRPGFIGTWAEAGVQCEACHGPGSNHIPNPSARDIFVDSPGAMTCKQCHSTPFDGPADEITGVDGFINPRSQWQELAASGGHAAFACTFCHDPHRGTSYDRAGAIRNECTVCHTEENMALHEGKVFVRPTDGYTETLTCESCHMPYAVKSGSSASTAAVGPLARVGDTRSHIFRITTEPLDYTGFFTPDGTRVVKDAEGRAALTVDFVCLRCHNDVSLPTLSFSVERAAEIAIGVHQEFE
ncbi:MAG: hypothetical protein DCC65_16135 [Planctomycetota bacterium]|nr:MAG: hypothetical protein DCC65_16135 [Planctomycetota bacterium]